MLRELKVKVARLVFPRSLAASWHGEYWWGPDGRGIQSCGEKVLPDSVRSPVSLCPREPRRKPAWLATLRALQLQEVTQPAHNVLRRVLSEEVVVTTPRGLYSFSMLRNILPQPWPLNPAPIHYVTVLSVRSPGGLG